MPGEYRSLFNPRALETAAAGGTTINWHSTFRPKVPGTGWLYRRALGKFITRTVEGLAVAADMERRS